MYFLGSLRSIWLQQKAQYVPVSTYVHFHVLDASNAKYCGPENNPYFHENMLQQNKKFEISIIVTFSDIVDIS